MFIKIAFEPAYNAVCIFQLTYFSDKVLFKFCDMCLLILPILFFARFRNVVVGQFKKSSL